MSARPRLRADGLAWEVVDDEIVVLDLTSSEYFGLNATGTVLWHALVDDAETDLVATLMKHFDVDEAQARSDVDRFLESLRTNGLLEP